MQSVSNEIKICPKCGRRYKAPPAISRADNITPICPQCGTREALEGMGLDKDEIERVIETIPKPTGEK